MEIWIDLENAPNALFFSPIVRGLRSAGYEVLVTARDYGQTLDMAAMKGLDAYAVGKHYEGTQQLMKVYCVLKRSLALHRFISQDGKVKLGIGHSSRSLAIASRILGIPSINMLDYESGNIRIFNLSTLVLVPEAISIDRLVQQGLRRSKIKTYRGLKEEQYIGDFTPEPGFLERLSIDSEKVLVVLRPPSNLAHYHNPEGDKLFVRLLEYLGGFSGVIILILARYKSQYAEIESFVRSKVFRAEVRVIDVPLDGLNLAWYADIVISGGGTMNREAALLDTPAYSIFMGLPPSVEAQLVRIGKVKRIESERHFHMVEIRKKNRLNCVPTSNTSVLEMLLDLCASLSKGETLNDAVRNY